MRTSPTISRHPLPRLLAATALAWAPAVPALAGGIAATIVVDGVPVAFSPIDVPLGDGRSLCLLNRIEPTWTSSGSLIAKPGLFPALGGQFVLENTSSAPIDVDATFVLPLSHSFGPPSIPRVAAGGAFAAGTGGGALTSSGATPLLAATIDGAVVASALAGPRTIAIGPAEVATIGPDSHLAPGTVGPAATSDIGLRWTFSLDPGCIAILSGTLAVDSPDLNGDGAVNGADLGILLLQWGGAGTADFDLSGTVDSADLGVLLTAWD